MVRDCCLEAVRASIPISPPSVGDEVASDISQPGGAELSDQRRGGEAPRLCASGNFGSGYAGLRNMRASGNPRPTQGHWKHSTVCRNPPRRNAPKSQGWAV